MNRRSFLLATPASVGLLSGCLSGSGGSLSLDITNVELEPGEETVLKLHAEKTVKMSFTRTPEVTTSGRGELDIDLDSEYLSPRPPNVAKSYPPRWKWNHERTIEGEIPIRAEGDLPHGLYMFEVRVKNLDGDYKIASGDIHIDG